MKLSPQLTDLNYHRYQQWEKPMKKEKEVKQAIALFNGAAYKGLDATSLSESELLALQDNLRILSGLYGILKPLDLIYPYRLEMGTKFAVDSKRKNLYAFWKDQLTDFLNKETTPDDTIVNLASTEYFKAIDTKKLQARVITPIFKEIKGDTYKVVMMYAKTARGKMLRYIVRENIENAEALKGYAVDGYSYNESLSSEQEWVFVR